MRLRSALRLRLRCCTFWPPRRGTGDACSITCAWFISPTSWQSNKCPRSLRSRFVCALKQVFSQISMRQSRMCCNTISQFQTNRSELPGSFQNEFSAHCQMTGW